MKTHITFLNIFTIAAIAILGALMFQVMQLKANPSQVVRNNPTIATTTLTFMTIGTATTTNTFNTQADGGANTDTSVFTVCLSASTTATVLNLSFEYSFDGITYMQDELGGIPTTTTGIMPITAPVAMTWAFASTSLQGAPVNPLNNSACKIVKVPTPIQYVRAVMSLTGANGAVWSDFGAKREQR